MSFPSGDGYRTPQMVQAERELDARVNVAFAKGRELQEKMAALDEKRAKDTEPLTNAEVDQFKAYILGHARTDEWQLVIDRIERGELSWRQVVEGVAAGRADREVAAALKSLTNVPAANLESLVASGVLPDLDRAQSDADAADAADAAGDSGDEREREAVGRGTAGRRPRAPEDDDDWFENQSVFN